MIGFETQTCCQNKSKLKGVFSRNNLRDTVKDGMHVVNRDKYKSIGTLWIVLCVNGNHVKNFDSFGTEHVPKEIKCLSETKISWKKIYRMREFYSVICG